jgi:hypothetical protein
VSGEQWRRASLPQRPASSTFSVMQIITWKALKNLALGHETPRQLTRVFRATETGEG